MMTQTPQLRKIAIKKRASHPSSVREPDLDFRKLVDKLEQAETTMKLEETENLKLQYVNKIKTNASQINNINNSDTELSKKITKFLNVYEKTQISKANHFSKNGVNIVDDTQTVSLNADRNNKITKMNHKNVENPTNLFINSRKKIKIYPTKTFIAIIVQEHSFQTTPTTLDNNHPIIQSIEDNHQTKEIYRISHKIGIVDQIVKLVKIQITIQDQIQINTALTTDLIQILEIEIIQIIDLETLHTIDLEILRTNGIGTIQTIEFLVIKIIDHAIIQTTDQNIIIIKIDHAIIHRREAQAITTDKEATLNHHKGITHVIKIHNKIIGVTHLNIKDK